MALTATKIVGQFSRTNGEPAKFVAVTATLSTTIRNGQDTGSGSVTVWTDDNGKFSLTVFANTDPGTVPSNSNYVVKCSAVEYEATVVVPPYTRPVPLLSLPHVAGADAEKEAREAADAVLEGEIDTTEASVVAEKERAIAAEAVLEAEIDEVGGGVGAWTEVTLGPKVEELGATQTLRARTEGGGATGRIRGGIQIKGGETLSAGETALTLPVGIRPPGLIVNGVETSGVPAPQVGEISAAGVVSFPSVALTTGAQVYFDGTAFNIT